MRHRCENSATAVRMTTVRKGHCAVICMHCFTDKTRVLGSSKPLFSLNSNPFPNPNLTEMTLPNPNPHPNPRTKTVWRVIRIHFHHVHGPVFRRSVGLSDPTLTLTLTGERKRETEREFSVLKKKTELHPEGRRCGFARFESFRSFVLSH